jgi:small subunit ribosomal protein S14
MSDAFYEGEDINDIEFLRSNDFDEINMHEKKYMKNANTNSLNKTPRRKSKKISMNSSRNHIKDIFNRNFIKDFINRSKVNEISVSGSSDHLIGRLNNIIVGNSSSSQPTKTAVLKKHSAPKFSTRRYNVCKICGRPHVYMRKHGICRLCFRQLAYKNYKFSRNKKDW